VGVFPAATDGRFAVERDAEAVGLARFLGAAREDFTDLVGNFPAAADLDFIVYP
jgi:hypothetical protein